MAKTRLKYKPCIKASNGFNIDTSKMIDLGVSGPSSHFSEGPGGEFSGGLSGGLGGIGSFLADLATTTADMGSLKEPTTGYDPSQPLTSLNSPSNVDLSGNQAKERGSNVAKGMAAAAGAMQSIPGVGQIAGAITAFGAALAKPFAALAARKREMESLTDNLYHPTQVGNMGSNFYNPGGIPMAAFGMPMEQYPMIEAEKGEQMLMNNNDMIPIGGNTHEQGGTMIPPEMMPHGDYIYSDTLGYNKDGDIEINPKKVVKTFADEAKKIESKFKKSDKGRAAQAAKEVMTEQLKSANEQARLLKEGPQIQEQPMMMANGGKFGDFNTSFTNKYFGVHKYAQNGLPFVEPDYQGLMFQLSQQNKAQGIANGYYNDPVSNIMAQDAASRFVPYPSTAPVDQNFYNSVQPGPVTAPVDRYDYNRVHGLQPPFNTSVTHPSPPPIPSDTTSIAPFLSTYNPGIIGTNTQSGAVGPTGAPSTTNVVTPLSANTTTSQPRSVSPTTTRPANQTRSTGELPYQTWERITGLPWSEAKRLGMTNGAFQSNLDLQKMLLAGYFGYTQGPVPTPTSTSTTSTKNTPKIFPQQLGLQAMLTELKAAGMGGFGKQGDTNSETDKKTDKNEGSGRNALTAGDKMQLAGLAPGMLYNMISALRKAENIGLATNPYADDIKRLMANRRFDITPYLLDAHMAQNLFADQLTNNSSSSATRNAGLQKGYANTLRQLAQVRGNENQMNNAYRGEEAAMLGNLGAQEVAARNLQEQLQTQTNAAKQMAGATAFTNLGQGLNQIGTSMNANLLNLILGDVLGNIAPEFQIGDLKDYYKRVRQGKGKGIQYNSGNETD